MKINWKARFKNKAFVISLCALAVSMIYKILDLFGIIPDVEYDQIIEVFSYIIDILSLMGIVVDPTTPGTKDSDRAMTYYADVDESVTTE